MNKAEKEARNKYMRDWRAKNPEKVKAATAKFWKKKAEKEAGEK